LLFADWLEETGEAHPTLRAEFIRLQCALEKLSPGDEQFRTTQAREHDLFREIWPELVIPIRQHFQLTRNQFRSPEKPRPSFFTQWLGLNASQRLIESLNASGTTQIGLLPRETVDEIPFYPEGLKSIEFRRGFIDDLTISTHTTPNTELWSQFPFEIVPLRGLTLREGDWLESWAELPLIPKLKKLSLQFESHRGSPDAALNLFNFTEPLQLNELELYQIPFDRESLQQFLSSWLMRQLEIFRWTAHDPDELLLLAHQPVLSSLHTLDLSYSFCGSLGLHHLARATALTNLRTLDLSNASIGDTGIRALCRSQAFPGLRQLHLHGNRLTDSSARDLSQATWLAQLKVLNLSGNPEITERGASSLARDSHLHGLATLILNEPLKRTDALPALRERFGTALIFE
jgi:hypothetical protein